MNWERTFAQWRMVTKAALEDGPANILERIQHELFGDLSDSLHAAGWRYTDLMGPLAPQITVKITDQHSNFASNNVVLLAETRALQLLNPDPLPDFGLFRWRKR